MVAFGIYRRPTTRLDSARPVQQLIAAWLCNANLFNVNSAIRVRNPDLGGLVQDRLRSPFLERRFWLTSVLPTLPANLCPFSWRLG